MRLLAHGGQTRDPSSSSRQPNQPSQTGLLKRRITVSSLPDFASFLEGLALELNAMRPDLPPSEHDLICCEFQSEAELGVALEHYGAGEHVFEVIAANGPTERLTDYFSDLEGRLALLRRAA